MKLRTTKNSIRIRIRKSELDVLESKGFVEESVQFPTGIVFKFQLVIENQDEAIHATFVENKLVLSIASKEAKKWITTSQVGIETNLNLPNEEQLHLLIEKDFPCLDRPSEDKSDTFWELAPDTPDNC